MASLSGRALPFRRFVRAFRRALAAMGVPSEAFHISDLTRWVVGFSAGANLLVGAALLALWALAGFPDLGLSGHGLAALILGVVFSTGLGSALMGLSFYGDRSSWRGEPEQPTAADVVNPTDHDGSRPSRNWSGS